MTLGPKSFVLDLLSAADGARVPVAALLRAAELFDLSPNRVRVALSRLCTRGHVRSAGRGEYCLGARARPLQDQVAGWREVAARVTAWRGGFLMVSTAGLRRADRGATRARERALRLWGFRQLRPQLWVRPDNLCVTLTELRERLTALGVDCRAVLARMDELDEGQRQEVFALWDGHALHAQYKRVTARLRDSARRLPKLAPETAAAEAFIEGGAAIRLVVSDPLLPSPLVDTEARNDFLQTLHEYDELGRGIWHRFLDVPGSAPKRTPMNGASHAAVSGAT